MVYGFWFFVTCEYSGFGHVCTEVFVGKRNLLMISTPRSYFRPDFYVVPDLPRHARARGARATQLFYLLRLTSDGPVIYSALL